MNSGLIAAAAALMTLIAEWLHSRRIRRVSQLAFGPGAGPRAWTRWAPVVRTAAIGLTVWGCLELLALGPIIAKPKELPEGGYRHVVIALDVSPSMQLKDAGATRDRSRARRASEVVMSLLSRIALEQIRVSVVAFYTDAKPVVIETFDLNVVKNIFDDLPLELAFQPGKTSLFEGIRQAAALAKPWQPESTTLIVVSDGDTVPDTGLTALPRSIAQVLIVGVGDPRAGKFIDGHQSRQDVMTLRQLALRLNGTYHDTNEKHLPSGILAPMAKVVPMEEQSTRRSAALAALAAGTLLLAGLPVGLAFAGSSWQPAQRGFGNYQNAAEIMRSKKKETYA